MALTRAWQRCVQAPHALTYEVVPGSGQVRNLRAAGVSAAELACLRRAANRAALAPAPPAVLRERLTLRPAGQ